jgi:hypothetical protein
MLPCKTATQDETTHCDSLCSLHEEASEGRKSPNNCSKVCQGCTAHHLHNFWSSKHRRELYMYQLSKVIKRKNEGDEKDCEVAIGGQLSTVVASSAPWMICCQLSQHSMPSSFYPLDRTSYPEGRSPQDRKGVRQGRR